MSDSLPPRPSLDHLKHQARSLQRAYADAEPDALTRVECHLPGFAGRLILAKAQTVIAREYGFDSWAQLRVQLFESVDKFCAAARNADIHQLQSLLDEAPRLINALDRKGWNALAHAGSKETIAFLLARGAVSPNRAREDTESALHTAVEAGNISKARHLLEQGADIACTIHHHQSSETTVLHAAARRGDVELLQLLFEYGAGSIIEARMAPAEEGRKSGVTALQAAALKGHQAAVQWLLEYGAVYDAFSAAALGDVDRLQKLADSDPAQLHARDDYDSTLLHWAAAAGQVEGVEYLLQAGLDIDARNRFGETALIRVAYLPVEDRPKRADVVALLQARGATMDAFSAAAMGDAATLAQMLARDPGQCWTVNEYDLTPLHFAAWNGDVETARQLLERGADPNTTDLNGCPPLFYSSYWAQSVETTELLLEHGADIFYQNIWGKGLGSYDASLDWLYWISRQGGSPVHEAALSGDVDRLRDLLDQDAALVHAKSRGKATPLHFAAAGNQVPALQLLSARGAELGARMDKGLTPLFVAARAGAADALVFLLEKGADVSARGDAWSAWTPLHGLAGSYFSRGDTIRAVELLLAAGADPNAEGGPGVTPLHHAVFNGYVEVSRKLIASGADVHHRTGLWNRETLLHTIANRAVLAEDCVAIIHLLVDCGLDVNAKDDAGRTPLDCAHHLESAAALRHHGAKLGIEL